MNESDKENIKHGMLNTFAHELTHVAENSGFYEELHKAIIEAYENSGKSFDKLVEEKTKKLCRENPNAKNMSEEELAYLADVEVIADSCETMLKNSKIFEDIAQGNPTLAQKIKDKLKNFIARLKQLLNKTNALTHEGKLLEECVTEFENINRIWDKAVTDGIKTANAMHAERKNNTADNSDVENSIRNTKDITWGEQINNYFSKNGLIKHSDTLVVEKNTPDYLLQYVDNLPLALPIRVISKAQSKKDISHSVNTSAIKKIQSGIRNAVATIYNEGRNSILFITDIKQGEYPLVVAFEINSVFDGDSVHKCTSIHLRTNLASYLANLNGTTVFVKNKNELNALCREVNILDRLQKNNRLIDVSLSQGNEDVKNESEDNTEYQSHTADIDNAYLEAVNNNDMETAQRLVDEAAERAFAESKIRDEDGKLLKVYHGTPKDFTVFRNSGSGMYFTADPDYARGYTQLNGKVLKTFLNIKKPFDILNDSIARKIFIDEFIKGGYAQGIHPSSTLTEINKYIQNGVDYIKNTLRFKDLEKKINNDTATEAEEQEYYDLDDAITKYETENKLSDYMKHPELFKAYPQLKDLKIYFRQSVNKGEYNSSTKTIIINPMNSAKVQREALIHEIQHAIQDIEGFAKGSSVGYWQKEGYSFNDSYDRYQRTAGEIESRDTAHRIDYADEERKSIQPDIYRTDAVLKEDSIKYSQRYYKQGSDFSKALSRKEWASFYSSLKKSNQRDAFRIGDNGILIPDKDNSNYKLVCYEDDSENLYITAVYKLENYDYNIHDGGLNIAQTIIDRKKAGLNEKHTKAILQSYSALSGAIFREYNGKTGRFIKLTRSGNKTVQYSGDESDRAGISENAGQGISESGVEDDFPQFQMRPDGGYSNRQLLAEALESSAQNNVTFHTEGVD